MEFHDLSCLLFLQSDYPQAGTGMGQKDNMHTQETPMLNEDATNGNTHSLYCVLLCGVL